MKFEAHVSKVNKEGSSLRARADITVENCVNLIGITVRENHEGELWVQDLIDKAKQSVEKAPKKEPARELEPSI